MTVIRKTGLIIVSTLIGTLHQLSLQEGRLIEKYIEPPCQHHAYLLCVQVAGREYLALSCKWCKTIKLMNLNKQKGNSSESQLMQYEAITAFSGEIIIDICQGEENRIFVRLRGAVLELDTSTTSFTRLRTIETGYFPSFCYVPDPHRLLVISHYDKVRAVSCDNNNYAGKVKIDDFNADI